MLSLLQHCLFSVMPLVPILCQHNLVTHGNLQNRGIVLMWQSEADLA